ncbi:MAG: pimeloyl-ACP methyl ester esterase BioH [gamma proteobacterium symbiont of Taylorina sp.]|nr:pimeloyl-ACP methyl ester esterase BioH [gamma proteobacterium symbiont of Taylorina sp.]
MFDKSTQLGTQKWGEADSNKQIVFIHGWGMNSNIWNDIAVSLELLHPDYSIIAVDLPGYGQSADYSLEQLGGHYNAQSLSLSLQSILEDRQNIIIAWSMGGLVAIELASRLTTEVSQLILVSSTPCFVQTDHWPHAVAVTVFKEFYQSLLVDHQTTLKRFLALQAMGSQTARQDIKFLYAQLFNRGQADNKALEYGLNMLLKEDKRQQLQQISQIPIHLISGKRDALVNYKSQKQLAEQNNISLHSISAAGHTPFISHPKKFKEILNLCF